MDELNAKWGYIGYYQIRHILSSKADDVNIFTNSELCKLIDFVNKIHVTGQNGLLSGKPPLLFVIVINI